MLKLRKAILLASFFALCAGWSLAQFNGGSRGLFGGNNGHMVRTEGGVMVDEETVRTARETAAHSVELPDWTNDPSFKNDTFSFARIIFQSNRNFGGRGGLGWVIDYPDADINLSFRLHQLTTMKVDPDCRVLKFTDADLYRYPFIFAEHVERMLLSNAEVLALRKYLQTGGVLMINDTWGDPAWANLEEQMKRVLPGRSWVDVPLDHPIFHCVYDLPGPLKQLQVPTIHWWNRDYDPNDPNSGPVSSTRERAFDEMHVRAWFDDKGHLMVIAIHNCDMPDGWEREGENEEYFHEFSVPRSYPLFINIIYYVMTH